MGGEHSRWRDFILLFFCAENGRLIQRINERALALVFFNAKGAALRKDMQQAIYDGDVERTRKTIVKYEAWEEKHNLKEKKRYANDYKRLAKEASDSKPIPLDQSYLSVYYRDFLSEMEQDWDSALRYADKFSELIADDPNERSSLDRGVSEKGLKARAHYKMGNRRQAFLDYCEIAPRRVADKDAAEYIKYRYFLKGGERRASSSASILWRFNYGDFLLFMEEEYEALGKPAKYEDAMNVYRAMGAEDSSYPVVVALDD